MARQRRVKPAPHLACAGVGLKTYLVSGKAGAGQGELGHTLPRLDGVAPLVLLNLNEKSWSKTIWQIQGRENNIAKIGVEFEGNFKRWGTLHMHLRNN